MRMLILLAALVAGTALSTPVMAQPKPVSGTDMSADEGPQPDLCEFKTQDGKKMMAPCMFANMKLIGKANMHPPVVTPTMPPVAPTKPVALPAAKK